MVVYEVLVVYVYVVIVVEDVVCCCLLSPAEKTRKNTVTIAASVTALCAVFVACHHPSSSV